MDYERFCSHNYDEDIKHSQWTGGLLLIYLICGHIPYDVIRRGETATIEIQVRV